MIKEIRNISKIFLTVIITSLIMINTTSHASDKTNVSGKPEVSGAEEINRHILNCLKPLGHHLFIKDFICPIGGENFQSLVLGTHSYFGRHLDWEPVSYLNFPAPLPVCPSNGFIISEDQYTDAELEEIKMVIESKEYKEIFSERHASYYLFAKLNEALKEQNNDHWWFLLQATWEADNCKDSEKYKIYAHEAIKAGKLFLKDKGPEDQEYWILNVVIPNLYRRLGDFESAQDWLDAFGHQIPENVDKSFDKIFFELTFNLLRKSVFEKDTSKIAVKP